MPVDSAARLILLCGLPGSGKTTAAERLVADQHDGRAVRLCPDEWMVELGIDLWDQPARARIERLQWQLAEQLLQAPMTVIVEWGLWSRAERDHLRQRAREIGAAVELRYLEAPVDVLWERIAERDMERRFGNRAIERHELVAWAASFEAPDESELAQYDPPPTSR